MSRYFKLCMDFKYLLDQVNTFVFALMEKSLDCGKVS